MPTRDRSRHRSVTWATVASFALAIGLLTSCSKIPPAPAAQPAVVIHMVEYRFIPAAVTVPRGSTVLIVNDGTMAHSWVIPKAGVGTGDVAPGRSVSLDLTGIAPGTYGVTCDLPGHAQLGEVGTVTITG